MYFNSLSKYDCSGCTACQSICPKHCISMVSDAEGFLYPKVDESKCINCESCAKVCPFENPSYANNIEPKAMAALLADVNERTRSSSGGVFFSIAKWVIEQGGIVYGATIDDNLDVYHIGVDACKDLRKLRGSKYVQSNLGSIFKDVKSELQKGRLCYFVGTGCQVAGLKAFLRKQYDNLITSDLVCHGAPSQKLFKEHIKFIESAEKEKVMHYSFRSTTSWKICEEYILAESKRYVCKQSFQLSPYLFSFMYGYTYRYSCYNCRFACIPRQGDITLADYWGVNKFFPEVDSSKGTSLILLNTIKGEEIWEKIKKDIIYYESTIKDGGMYNHNLEHKTSEPTIRKDIYQKIDSLGYRFVSKHYFRPNNYWYLILKYKLKNILSYLSGK